MLKAGGMSDDFDEDIAFEAAPADTLALALDGFEGPLALLLDLARARKVDLHRISISELAGQYLAFIAAAKSQRIDLSAEYLVMAAWLAYLKSRLILPVPQLSADEPDPEELAAALKRKLEHLAQARAAAKRLMQLPQWGVDMFPYGAPQPMAVTRETRWRADIMDLLTAYCREATKHVRREHKLKPRRAYSLTDARRRLEKIIAEIEDWRALDQMTPAPEAGPDAPPPSSYLASVFGAALELAREGKLELRQQAAFAPLYLRGRHEAGA